MVSVPLSAAVVFYLLAFGKYLHESIYTPQGKLCRVKCSLAALAFLSMAGVLGYGILYLKS